MRDYMGTFQTASAAFSQHFHRFHSIDKREAGLSLAELWRDQGKRTEARDLFASIYGWFSEGAGTFDLEQARCVLETLTPTDD